MKFLLKILIFWIFSKYNINWRILDQLKYRNIRLYTHNYVNYKTFLKNTVYNLKQNVTDTSGISKRGTQGYT
jgi:hypothetical protein